MFHRLVVGLHLWGFFGGILGVCVLLPFLLSIADIARPYQSGLIAGAEVVEVVEGRSDNSRILRVRFRTERGETVTREAANHPLYSYRVGQTVTVRYDPDNPDKVVLPDSLWVLLGLMLVETLLFEAAAVWLAIRLWRGRRRDQARLPPAPVSADDLRGARFSPKHAVAAVNLWLVAGLCVLLSFVAALDEPVGVLVSGHRAEAKVAERTRGSRYNPGSLFVRFQTPQGETVTHEAVYHPLLPYWEGQWVTVIYDPRDPARPALPEALWFQLLVMACTAALFGLLPLWVGLRKWWRAYARRIDDLA